MPRRLIVLAVCVALLAAAGAGVAAIHAATGSAESDPGVCLKHPRRAMVGHGVSPDGQRWYIVSHLRNDGKCRTRLLDIFFYPFGPSNLNPFGPSDLVWGEGYGVPRGGSLSSTFVISSRLAKKNGEIAYGGITSGRVALVEAFTRQGRWIKIEPVKPELPTPPTWLRNVRYFMEYLPTNEKVELIRVRDRAGRVLYQGRESVLGGFEDAGVL